MIAPSDVSGVIPTRGDVDMLPVIQSLAELSDVHVYDNSIEPDLAVYGRYAAIARCRRDVILTVDDDVLLDRESVHSLCAAYEPGVVTCNMPQPFRHSFYEDHALVGFGAIFDRALPERAFKMFIDKGWDGRLTGFGGRYAAEFVEGFRRTCDIVFTGLTPRKLVDLPYEDREFASAPNRMWRQPQHMGERAAMLELVRQVRDRVAA